VKLINLDPGDKLIDVERVVAAPDAGIGEVEGEDVVDEAGGNEQ
jgi:hypothetical protein